MVEIWPQSNLTEFPSRKILHKKVSIIYRRSYRLNLNVKSTILNLSWKRKKYGWHRVYRGMNQENDSGGAEVTEGSDLFPGSSIKLVRSRSRRGGGVKSYKIVWRGPGRRPWITSLSRGTSHCMHSSRSYTKDWKISAVNGIYLSMRLRVGFRKEE